MLILTITGWVFAVVLAGTSWYFEGLATKWYMRYQEQTEHGTARDKLLKQYRVRIAKLEVSRDAAVKTLVGGGKQKGEPGRSGWGRRVDESLDRAAKILHEN